jgi:hypothetical protein
MQKKKRSRSSTGKKSRARKKTQSAGVSLRDTLTKIQSGIDKVDADVINLFGFTARLTNGMSLANAVGLILNKVNSL